jgi:hypothetical protein
MLFDGHGNILLLAIAQEPKMVPDTSPLFYCVFLFSTFEGYPTSQDENLKEPLNPVKSGLGQQFLDSIRRYEMNGLHPFLHAIFHLFPCKTR